jgi:hypothetical protein
VKKLPVEGEGGRDMKEGERIDPLMWQRFLTICCPCRVASGLLNIIFNIRL